MSPAYLARLSGGFQQSVQRNRRVLEHFSSRSVEIRQMLLGVRFLLHDLCTVDFLIRKVSRHGRLLFSRIRRELESGLKDNSLVAVLAPLVVCVVKLLLADCEPMPAQM